MSNTHCFRFNDSSYQLVANVFSSHFTIPFFQDRNFFCSVSKTPRPSSGGSGISAVQAQDASLRVAPRRSASLSETSQAMTCAWSTKELRAPDKTRKHDKTGREKEESVLEIPFVTRDT